MHVSGAALVALNQGTLDDPGTLEHVQNKLTIVPYFWNPETLAYEVGRQTSTATGGPGSSAVDANLTSAGSTRLVGVVGQSTPGSSDNYFWTRNISAGSGSTVVDINSISSSTAHIGDVSISNPTTSVTISNPTTSVTISNPSTTVDANLSSAGSTRLVGKMDINSISSSTAHLGDVSISNPTTSVTVTSGVVLGAGSSANTIGSVALVAGTTGNVVGAVAVSSGVVLGAGSSANTLGSVTLAAGTSANILGAVAVTSGVVLGAGSSANTLGSVALVAGTSGNTIGSVALVAGTSANLVGGVVINSGTTAITVGSVALLAGSSANTVGSVALLAGTTGNVVGAVAITSGVQTIGNLQKPSAAARTTFSISTVDSTMLVPNTARFGAALYNAASCDALVGMSTVAVTTTSYSFKLLAGSYWEVPFGYTGGLRAIWTTSGGTGGMFITEITS